MWMKPTLGRGATKSLLRRLRITSGPILEVGRMLRAHRARFRVRSAGQVSRGTASSWVQCECVGCQGICQEDHDGHNERDAERDGAFWNRWRVILFLLGAQEMVARTHVGSAISVRCSYIASTEFCRGAIYLHPVLGHSHAEKNLAVMETSRSRDWDVSGASPANCLLRNTGASLWYIRPLVLRPFANQAASHRMA